MNKNNLSRFVSNVPVKNRDKILSFLKQQDDNSILSPRTFIDPITNKIAVCPIESHEINGFVWSNITTYLFEKYNIKLNDDFVKMFD